MTLFVKNILAIFHSATKKFVYIDGAQRAAAFSYYAFLSLFPFIILLVAIASNFYNPDTVSEYVLNYIENYFPLSEQMQKQVFNTIFNIVKTHKPVGLFAFLFLLWGSIKFLNSLVLANNKAWDEKTYHWWKLPLKSLLLLIVLIIAILVGILAPLILRVLNQFLFPNINVFASIYKMFTIILPLIILFFSLSVFYKFTPSKIISLNKTWASAFFVTSLFFIGQSAFVFLIKNFFKFNAVYGAFAEIIVFLLWIYFTGYIFIYGACLCASQSKK